MNNMLEDAASRLSVDVDALVAGGLARGRRLRRRRQVLAGAGSVAAVAVLGIGSVAVAQQLGSRPVAVPGAGPSSAAPTPTGTTTAIPPRLAAGTHATYVGGTDARLALGADQIHARLSGMLAGGAVGPILTQAPYPVVSSGTDRIEHFTYNGSLVSFIINAAAGSESCESLAVNADPRAGYSACRTVGDSKIVTEQTSGAFALNSAIAWHHGYQISVLSYAAGPSGSANPAMDGKKMQRVSDHPPISVDQLVQIATSDAWFQK